MRAIFKLHSMVQPGGRAVTRSSLKREARGSNLEPVKSNTALSTARHRCDISSKGAVLPGRNYAEMGPANSLHASAYYSEYNERFDLILRNCYVSMRLRTKLNRFENFDWRIVCCKSSSLRLVSCFRKKQSLFSF